MTFKLYLEKICNILKSKIMEYHIKMGFRRNRGLLMDIFNENHLLYHIFIILNTILYSVFNYMSQVIDIKSLMNKITKLICYSTMA